MTTELIKSENIQSIGELAPEALTQNQISVQRCTSFGLGLLSKVESEGMNDMIDVEIQTYIKRVSETLTKMNDKRSPVTKLFDTIRSTFTELEKSIDIKTATSPAFKLQQLRNEYARKKIEEQERIRIEEIRRQSAIKARADYKAEVETELFNYFSRHITSKINELIALNRSITLENFDEVSACIESFRITYDESHFNKFTSGAMIPAALSLEICKEIQKQVLDSKYTAFSEQFSFDLSDQKQAIVQLLPSKKKELQDIEAQSALDAEAALKRQADLKQKEEYEAAKREEERKQQAEIQKASISTRQQQDVMGALFNSQAACVSAPVKVQTKKKIKVTDTRGYLDILNMWWLNEGVTLSLEELEKKLKPQTALCEKLANDKVNPQYIKSQYVEYEDEIKAK